MRAGHEPVSSWYGYTKTAALMYFIHIQRDSWISSFVSSSDRPRKIRLMSHWGMPRYAVLKKSTLTLSPALLLSVATGLVSSGSDECGKRRAYSPAPKKYHARDNSFKDTTFLYPAGAGEDPV